MRKDRFNVGDVLVKKEKGQEPIHRKITAVRDSGYSWIYVDDEREIEFYSEDSSDPFFEWKWELVDMSENKTGKEDLYSGYYLTNDERLGSFHGYKTEDEKVIVALVDILGDEKFFVDADEIRRLNHDEALYFADQIRSAEHRMNFKEESEVTRSREYEQHNLYVVLLGEMNSRVSEEREVVAVFNDYQKASNYIVSKGFKPCSLDGHEFYRKHEHIVGKSSEHTDYAYLEEFKLNTPSEEGLGKHYILSNKRG